MPTTMKMLLELPAVGADDGVWDDKINAALTTVDTHDHTSGKGALIPTAGLKIDAALNMNGYALSNAQMLKIASMVAVLNGTANAGSLQNVNGDSWWVNGSGTAVQITNGSTLSTTSTTNTPAGLLLPFAGTSAPGGYLIADGGAVSRIVYATLFAAIGTTYGAGDLTTTFNLPDASGRTLIGAGVYSDPLTGSITRTLGQTLGAEKHLLLTSEIANHNHTGTTGVSGAHNHKTVYYQNGVPTNTYMSGLNTPVAAQQPSFSLNGVTGTTANSSPTSTDGDHTHNFGTSNTGGGQAHNNMQPSLAINYIIKT